MTRKLEYIKQLITELPPNERGQLDSHIIQAIAGDAEAMTKQYGIVTAEHFIPAAKELRAQWGNMQGLSCGFKSIDNLTHGFVGGETIVIGGATSMGKTTLAVNMTARMIGYGAKILFVTLEMTREQLTSRLLFVHDGFEEQASSVVFQQADELNWQSVDGLISGAVHKYQVDIVVIDHLHYFTRELNNVAEDLGRITKEFKKNAIRYNIPIIMLSHTRKGEGTDINDLRGSSYIAQDADIVLMVSRESEFPDKMIVTCMKNRNRGFDPKANQILLTNQSTKLSEAGESPW